MNIAILGFGTVGSGVYEIVKHAQTDFTKQLDVKHILIRKGKAAKRDNPEKWEKFVNTMKEKNISQYSLKAFEQYLFPALSSKFCIFAK